MSLLEALVEADCPLTFKGGSSLMLILKDSLHRLSIDVDVICPPGTDIEKYLATCFEKSITDIEKYDRNAASTSALRLQKTVPLKLAHLRTSNPEAFWYWVKISELLCE